MSLFPNSVAGKRPRRADADEEVTLGFSQHKTNDNEEQANRR